jgi:hypothetical protein
MPTISCRFLAGAVLASFAAAALAPAATHAGTGVPGGSSPTAQGSPASWTQATQSYSVELDIGPVETMTMSMNSPSMGSANTRPQTSMAGMNMGAQSHGSMPSGMAMGGQTSMSGMPAMSGEVMMSMPGSPMPQMNSTDQGQSVNHHLEVHLKDASSGAVLTNPVPSISITDASGNARPLSNIVQMYDPSVGQSDVHFGNNVYLPDGTYTVTVTIGPDTATFLNITVSGGASGT